MKSVLIVLLAIAVAAQAIPQQKKVHFLCDPCKWVFKEVEKELPEIDQLTEELLDAAVKLVCKRVTFGVPFVDHVCVKLGDEVVADLYKFILTLDHYDPTVICQHLDMC